MPPPANVVRKSLPTRFTPYINRVGLVGSPTSDGSEFSPEASTRSPSPSLRTRVSISTLQRQPKHSLGLGLGHTLLTSSNAPHHTQHSHKENEAGIGIFARGRGAVSPVSPSGAIGPAPPTEGDLLSEMGISKKRANMMRRTDSNAWSFSSESTSDGYDNLVAEPTIGELPIVLPWERKPTDSALFILNTIS